MAKLSERTAKLVEEIKKEFPKFEVLDKNESPLMKFIFYISLQFLWNKAFMTRYTTVMFGKVYTQKEMFERDDFYHVLRHERVHLRDAKKYPIFFELSYLLLLPAFLSMRAFWEFRGYCESLKSMSEDQNGAISKGQLNWAVSQFTGPAYLFMFPFKNVLTNKFMNFLDKEGIKLLEE